MYDVILVSQPIADGPLVGPFVFRYCAFRSACERIRLSGFALGVILDCAFNHARRRAV